MTKEEYANSNGEHIPNFYNYDFKGESPKEQKKIGPAVDIRGTQEEKERLKKVFGGE